MKILSKEVLYQNFWYGFFSSEIQLQFYLFLDSVNSGKWKTSNFFTLFIENKYKNGIYSVVSNLNHGNEPNLSQDFDIDYHTCNKKD